MLSWLYSFIKWNEAIMIALLSLWIFILQNLTVYLLISFSNSSTSISSIISIKLLTYWIIILLISSILAFSWNLRIVCTHNRQIKILIY